MTGIILAWLVGEGLMVYKDVSKQHRPPMPADLLATSGLFVLLALLGESQPKIAALLAWGFDAAAFVTLWDQTAQKNPKAKPSPLGLPPQQHKGK